MGKAHIDFTQDRQLTIDAVIDETIHEHIIMFVLQDMPPLDIGKRYRVTLERIPDTTATIPPREWRANGD